MSSEKRNKCEVTEGVWKLCHPLTIAIGEANQRRRGIGEVQVVNLRTSKTRTLAVIHRHTSKHCGLVMNWCPWCGVNIEPKSEAK